MRALLVVPALLLFVVGPSGCGGSGWGGGSNWVGQPLVAEEERPGTTSSRGRRPAAGPPVARTIGAAPEDTTSSSAAGLVEEGNRERSERSGGGRVLGVFRNTYYDFPNEADHHGAKISLMNGSCQPIAQVPRSFYDAVCVQGSGSLAQGGTVSFAKRDCACAEICPRTNQRICFDALDRSRFPWGRGAAGVPITPFRTVAADTKVLPMGTVLYIPELDGVPRGTGEGALDGCFIVEDRGIRIQGEHVDIFTGQPTQTAALNARVPSNRGVTVIVDAPKCAHLAKR